MDMSDALESVQVGSWASPVFVVLNLDLSIKTVVMALILPAVLQKNFRVV